MNSCEGTPASATELQHFDNTTADLGWPRVAEVADKPDGTQGIDEDRIETLVSSGESCEARTFSNAVNESRRPAINTTRTSQQSILIDS